MVCLQDIATFVNSLDIGGLQNLQNLINQVISSKLPATPPSSTILDVNNYVEYHDGFLDPTDKSLILAEIDDLNFNLKRQSDSVQNRFISPFSESYNWKSRKGQVVNKPLQLDKFPTIKRVMDMVNKKVGCSTNSVLVTCYSSGDVNCRLHEDDEKTLDASQPICVLSLGVERKVEFVANSKFYKYSADLALEPKDGSLYIMISGCQSKFKHRVRKDHSIKEHRFSLSFRCFVPGPVAPPSIATSSATSSGKPVPLNNIPTTPTHGIPSSTPNFDSTRNGFSAFHEHNTMSSSYSSQQNRSDKVCLLFGSSITKHVDGDRMSRASRVTINLSESGARIPDVNKAANLFFADNQALVNNVDKIIINIGTNDVKWLNGRRFSVSRKFRVPLCNLIRDLRFMFPMATITFVPMLPIRALYNYTAGTVNDFNRLLLNLCREFGCIFYDCFGDFLAHDLRDYNSELFRDKWHLNESGLRLLCRALKNLIFGHVMSSHVRTSWHYPFY